MAVHSLKTVQKIPVSLETAWQFFSNPDNLQIITPPEMSLHTISKQNEPKIYEGQIIEYKVKPFAGISMYWMTEITHIRDREYFIDEQRAGPYSLWYHQHQFKAIDNVVEMTDIVHYKIPLWFLGDWMHALFIRKKLMKLFLYRYRKIEELFGKWQPEQAVEIIIR